MSVPKKGDPFFKYSFLLSISVEGMETKGVISVVDQISKKPPSLREVAQTSV